MYESPITLINGAFYLNLEDGVYKAVRQTGVVVDKDELIKALKYDRDQYNKGYADAKAEQKRKKFIDIITEYPVQGGKPYFSIRYEENGEIFEGFGTYKPEVLAEYIHEFMEEEQ